MASTSGSTEGTTALRAPRQTRGAKRIEEILEAAGAVIAEVGVDAASVQMIAERAGASMGSLYHFFPSKQAIVQALAETAVVEVTRANEQATSGDMLQLPLEPLFERVVMGQVELMQRFPWFDAVHDAVLHAPGGRALYDRMDRALVEQVERFLAARMPAMPEALRIASARFAVTAVHGVMDVALLLEPAQREAVTRELRTALVRYYAPYDAAFGPSAK